MFLRAAESEQGANTFGDLLRGEGNKDCLKEIGKSRARSSDGLPEFARAALALEQLAAAEAKLPRRREGCVPAPPEADTGATALTVVPITHNMRIARKGRIVAEDVRYAQLSNFRKALKDLVSFMSNYRSYFYVLLLTMFPRLLTAIVVRTTRAISSQFLTEMSAWSQATFSGLASAAADHIASIEDYVINGTEAAGPQIAGGVLLAAAFCLHGGFPARPPF